MRENISGLRVLVNHNLCNKARLKRRADKSGLRVGPSRHVLSMWRFLSEPPATHLREWPCLKDAWFVTASHPPLSTFLANLRIRPRLQKKSLCSERSHSLSAFARPNTRMAPLVKDHVPSHGRIFHSAISRSTLVVLFPE